jgi:hypothetical protein
MMTPIIPLYPEQPQSGLFKTQIMAKGLCRFWSVSKRNFPISKQQEKKITDQWHNILIQQQDTEAFFLQTIKYIIAALAIGNGDYCQKKIPSTIESFNQPLTERKKANIEDALVLSNTRQLSRLYLNYLLNPSAQNTSSLYQALLACHNETIQRAFEGCIFHPLTPAA